MAQWLRTVAILSEDPGMLPNFYLVVHKHLELQFQGTQCSLLFSEGMHTAHRCTCRQNTHTFFFKKKS